ncbi:MAG: type II toxin-antitoxin system RelE/ParE family toxin [Christensenella sp.]
MNCFQLREIADEYEKLTDFPNMGADIAPVIGLVTGFRMLVCGHYNVFYKVDGEYVSIYRILYYRQNFISILFGIKG